MPNVSARPARGQRAAGRAAGGQGLFEVYNEALCLGKMFRTRRKNIAEGQKMNDFGFSDIFLASHRKITKNCFARMESLTPKLMNEGFPIKPG